MKLSQLTKPLCATAIALSLGTLSILPASAQTGTTPETTIVDPPAGTLVEEDDGFDWGWLGLLGLIGLAGLKGKSEDHRETYRDPSIDPTRTTTRTTDYNR